jgi:hypothetical protein
MTGREQVIRSEPHPIARFGKPPRLARFREVYDGIVERNLEVVLARLDIPSWGPRHSVAEPLGHWVHHALHREGLGYVGNAFRTEKGRAVRHLEMQVWPIRIPAVSDQCQDLASVYPLANLDANAAGWRWAY